VLLCRDPSWAVLSWAVLSWAVLSWAVLSWAVLCRAVLWAGAPSACRVLQLNAVSQWPIEQKVPAKDGTRTGMMFRR
jgi:hypothetical protein